MGINLCTLVMARPTEKYNPRDTTLHCKRELCLMIGVNLHPKKAILRSGQQKFSFLPKIRGEHSFSKILTLMVVTQEHFKL